MFVCACLCVRYVIYNIKTLYVHAFTCVFGSAQFRTRARSQDWPAQSASETVDGVRSVSLDVPYLQLFFQFLFAAVSTHSNENLLSDTVFLNLSPHRKI